MQAQGTGEIHVGTQYGYKNMRDCFRYGVYRTNLMIERWAVAALYCISDQLEDREMGRGCFRYGVHRTNLRIGRWGVAALYCISILK
jgi:hypothetical protein